MVHIVNRVGPDAHRIECLAELPTRRQVPLRELMAEMGIEPSIDA